jgi:hypothetical protein
VGIRDIFPVFLCLGTKMKVSDELYAPHFQLANPRPHRIKTVEEPQFGSRTAVDRGFLSRRDDLDILGKDNNFWPLGNRTV